MKIITTALLAAGLASLAACGGGGAANNGAAANNVVEELPPVENLTDLNVPAPELNVTNAVDANAASATNTTNAL